MEHGGESWVENLNRTIHCTKCRSTRTVGLQVALFFLVDYRFLSIR
jgi:hypothetical protein